MFLDSLLLKPAIILERHHIGEAAIHGSLPSMTAAEIEGRRS
jgi:hypothetical protein